ncbi:MAG: hypothetical protein V8Q54_07180 [Alistipes senegalensis]
MRLPSPDFEASNSPSAGRSGNHNRYRRRNGSDQSRNHSHTRLFGLALKAPPLGVVAVAMGAVVGAFTYFKTQANEATSAQRTFNEITKAAAGIEDEHGVNLVSKAEKISQLMRVCPQDEASSEERRTAAIAELQELIPGGIELINQETIANGKPRRPLKPTPTSSFFRHPSKPHFRRRGNHRAGRQRQVDRRR